MHLNPNDMKTTSDILKSIKAQVKYMIDNQYYATLSILKEQNEMFSTKRSANDQHEISEFNAFSKVLFCENESVGTRSDKKIMHLTKFIRMVV